MECKKCLFDTETTDAVLDKRGVCNYCQLYARMNREYPTSAKGEAALVALTDEIKANKKPGQKYDCVIGVSGGLDSSYLLYRMVKDYGLTPLAVHFNNGWNTENAAQNMQVLCDMLQVDFEEYAVDPTEFDDIIKAFIVSGVLDIDAATDIGLITVLYQAAEKHGIHYIVEGHSFRTEGVQPLNWAYVDGKYIADVHEKYGAMKMETYPNLWFSKFVKWTALKKIKRVRPLYYMDYDKVAAAELLTQFGFKRYGGHHHENKWSTFNYTYYLPKRADIDGRKNEICAYVRRGLMTKEQAREKLAEPIVCPDELLEEVTTRMGMTKEQLDEYIKMPIRTWKEFKTYKPLFKRTKLLWYILYKTNVVPKSFYYKYCE